MNLTKQVNQTVRNEYSMGTQLILFSFLSLGYFMMLLLVAVRLPIVVLPFECLLAVGFAFLTMKAVLKLKILFSLTTWKKYWHDNKDRATWDNETFKLSWIGTFLLLHLLYSVYLPFETTIECLTELGLLGLASFGFNASITYGFSILYQVCLVEKSKKTQHETKPEKRPLQVTSVHLSHFEQEISTLNELLRQISAHEMVLDIETEHQLTTDIKRLENMLHLMCGLRDASMEARTQARKNIQVVFQHVIHTLETIITAHEAHIVTEIEKQARFVHK